MRKSISWLCLAGACMLLSGCLSKGEDKNERKILALQPFENFPTALMDTIEAAIIKTYDFKTLILKPKDLPIEAFTKIKSPRYRADVLIQQLKDEKPDSIDYIMGLTTHDISMTKRDPDGKIKEPESKYADWGVFGLGYRPGPSCVISTFRLDRSNNQFIERVKKVALHELGHNSGLQHCKTEGCVMRDAAETIKTIDAIKPALCSSCTILLHMKR